MNRHDRIYVAGHRGMVGSAIWRSLEGTGYTNLVGRTRDELDLTDQHAVEEFFIKERPQYVFLAAARVGGIRANQKYPAEFIRENLAVQTNVIHSAWSNGVDKLLYLGSSCIYPRHASQPIREDSLLTGPLEETNKPYAIAKIAGMEMCEAYRRQYGFNAISAMPTNLFGPGDNFDLETSHVLPALIRKFHDAKEHKRSHVEVWGTGTPRREFLHVDDMADAVTFLMEHYDEREPVNVGAGKDISIMELATLVNEIVGGGAEIKYNTKMPDGTPRKVLDITRLNRLGWKPRISLRKGIESTYEHYRRMSVNSS